MSDSGVSIAPESPETEEVRQLVDELNSELSAMTPPDFCYHMTVEEMAAPDTTVFIVRDGGVAIACGALKRHGDGIGEVKRMFTRPSRRGKGIGGLIVNELEAHARATGLRQLVLETGTTHDAAWRVYERAGFRRCGPVLDYPASEHTVFYQKPLVARTENI